MHCLLFWTRIVLVSLHGMPFWTRLVWYPNITFTLLRSTPLNLFIFNFTLTFCLLYQLYLIFTILFYKNSFPSLSLLLFLYYPYLSSFTNTKLHRIFVHSLANSNPFFINQSSLDTSQITTNQHPLRHRLSTNQNTLTLCNCVRRHSITVLQRGTSVHILSLVSRVPLHILIIHQPLIHRPCS